MLQMPWGNKGNLWKQYLPKSGQMLVFLCQTEPTISAYLTEYGCPTEVSQCLIYCREQVDFSFIQCTKVKQSLHSWALVVLFKTTLTSFMFSDVCQHLVAL